MGITSVTPWDHKGNSMVSQRKLNGQLHGITNETPWDNKVKFLESPGKLNEDYKINSMGITRETQWNHNGNLMIITRETP